METSEVKKIVIAKPVPSRPSPSTFRTFSELLASAINASPSNECPAIAVTAIKPKTRRFRPGFNHISPEVHGICVPSGKSEVVYMPMAKLASSTTVPVLANPSDSKKATDCSKPALENLEEAHKSCYDGYNWRKYGQKQVKGSEYPRSYYKCTHLNCPVKKKVERTLDDTILEVVYTGEHNHSKPERFKRVSGSSSDRQRLAFHQLSEFENENDDGGSSCRSAHSSSAPLVYDAVMTGEVNEDCDEVSNRFKAGGDGANGKRRRNPNHLDEAETSKESTIEPRIIVQNQSDSGILGDGFHWRKYGQKVVKGNTYPRSYYRCTSVKCNVRKYVERTSDDDSKAFITTYEGRHNHDMPKQKHKFGGI